MFLINFFNSVLELHNIFNGVQDSTVAQINIPFPAYRCINNMMSQYKIQNHIRH